MTDELTRLANAVLWPGFLGTEAPDWLLAELHDGLAGVVYFSQNVGDGLSALSDEILRANPDALIGIDEEGGNVTRLESTAGSTLPGAAQLGIVDDVEATRDSGAELARRVAAIGANVVLGPVADVNTDPRNPVIGVRSFGSDEELVARHVQAAVDGLQSSAVAACVKHFPGHGDTHLDSHHALPEISLGVEEFERVHLAPFRAAIAAGVDAIMTAHIVVPAWGQEPATLNPRVLGMLRDWGFDGVIITDALDMAAIRETVGIGQGAARALAAGADLLCIGNPTNRGEATFPDQDRRDFLAARDGILAAVIDGSLPRERLAAAAQRVARLGETLRSRAVTAPPVDYDASEIVRRAITGATADAEALAVVDARRRSTLAVDSASAYVAETLAADGHRVRVDVARTSIDEQDAALEQAVLAEGLTVILLDRPDADDAQRSLVERAAVRDPEAVVVNVGLAARRPLPLAVVEVASASRIGAQAARDRLIGGPRAAPIRARQRRWGRLRQDDTVDDDVLALVRRSVPRLSAAEARVAETILGDPTLVVDLAINDLAQLCHTSLSTVARFAQSLGFSGYRELRVAVARTVTLAQAQRARFGLDTTAIDPDDEPSAIAAKLAAQEIDAIEKTALGLDADALDRVARAVVAARHVDLFGQAASSLTAQDLQQKLARIGCSVAHSADPHLALTTASLRTSDDVVIAFSHGGETQEVVRAVEIARDAGALSVAITSAPDSTLALAADIALITYAQESPFRMAAMSSRIAQLALVDILFVRVVQHRGEPVVIPLQLTHDAAASRRRR